MCKSDTGEYDEVSSVFAIPNSRGRIYVETTDTFKAFELLKGGLFVSWKSMYVVPIHEREQLLSPVRSRKVVKVGGWVRIRCGLYRRDIAQVQDFDENEKFYNLKVVPRIKPPVPMSRTGKRARIHNDRPTPQRLRRADAISKYGKNKVKERDEGFEFKSHFYNEDGLRIIRLRHDAIQRISPTMQQIRPFVDAAIERIQFNHPLPEDVTINTYNDEDIFATGEIDINDIDIEPFLSVGVEVLVVGGDVGGIKGRVVAISTKRTVTISTTEHIDGSSSTIQVEANTRDVRPVFSVGESVTVKLGAFEGRRGIVEAAGQVTIILRDKDMSLEVID